MRTPRPTWAACHAAGMTAKDAAAARGVTWSAAHAWARRNGLRWSGLTYRVPTTDGQTIYRSQRAAAKALGVTPPTVLHHLNKHGNLANIGKRSRKGQRGHGLPIRIGNETFPSRRAAAVALGVSKATLYHWLHCRPDLLTRALMRRDAKATTAAMRDAEMMDGQNRTRRAA